MNLIEARRLRWRERFVMVGPFREIQQTNGTGCGKLYCTCARNVLSVRQTGIALSPNLVGEFRKEWQPEGEQRPRRLQQQRVSQIILREGDSLEVALKRFSRKVQQEGVLSEAKRRQHYEPPSVKRKRQADARERKARKRQAKLAARGY